MAPSVECVSCGVGAKTTGKLISEISAISGRSLKEIVTAHFWQDGGLMGSLDRKNALLCRDCHALIEQIDAFEQSLMKTRESFELRRTKSNGRVKKETLDNHKDIGEGIASSMKQEPDEWTTQDDFEWDPETTNNFLDASLQELSSAGKENSAAYLGDESNEDIEDKEELDETFVPSRGTRRGRKPKQKIREWSQTEMCLAKPDRRLVCQDRSLLGADWFAEQRVHLNVVLSDLEADVDYLRLKMLPRLSSAEESNDWSIALLRSESDPLECNLPEELTCFYCHKTYPSVVTKLEHIVENHCGDERQFICGMCPEYDEIFEANMFTHISENHIISDPTSEKCRYGNREPIHNEVDNTFACRLCPMVTRSVLAFWYHWYVRHKKYRLRQCDICGKSTGIETAEKFRSHFLTEHCSFTYECFECSTQLSTSESFLTHIKDHEENQMLVTKTGRGKKRNYPAERKSRSKRNSLGIKMEDSVAADDSNADPLSPVLRVQVNPEVCLEPTCEDEQVQLAELLAPEMWQDITNGLTILKSMPSKIDSDESSDKWDVCLLKLECPKLMVGVPGDRKCYKCQESFPTIPEKQSHIISSHLENPFYCAICQQAFNKEASGVTHMLNKHCDSWKTDPDLKIPENYIICEVCGLSCSSELAFWHHKLQSHKRYKNISCPLCDTSCNNFIVFLRHVLIRHAGHKYKCFLCDKTSKTVESFKEHLKQHGKGKIKKESSVTDDNDDSNFEREEVEINGKKILRKKIGKKGKKPPVACHICGTVSKGAFNNARHLYTMHGIKREVQCDKCDTVCESVRAMLEHKKNHHSSASCHLCGKVFVEKGHLENHLMRHGIGKDGKNHQNERDFMCEICSKTFTRKNYLVIHMKNHAEKSIKCTVCSKMFRWNSALQAHLTAAHGMGPKEGACTCEFCGRQFQDKSNYRQHRYTHLQVKPFNCEACGKGFIRRDLMKSHKEKCHAAATFSMA